MYDDQNGGSGRPERRHPRRRMHFRAGGPDELRSERGPHRHGPRSGPGGPGPGFGPGPAFGFGPGPAFGFGSGGPGGPGFGPEFGAGFGRDFPGGPGARDPRGRHRGRGTRRGDVRAAVLALLAERPMHGYEVIREIEERSGGRWRPSPGSVYPTLQLLADEGLVTGDESGGRRLFTLTETGTAEAAKHTANAPWAQHGDDPEWDAVRQMRAELGQLGMAVKQVIAVGTEAQRAEILTAIADVRRQAYRLLAESPDVAAGPDDRSDDVPPVPPTPPAPPVPPVPPTP